MKLTTDQKRILERLTEAHQELVYDRGMARVRLQELVNKELVTKERVQSKIANDALEAGVPKSQVGLAMGTRDWNLINRVIDLTREEREVEAEMTKPKAPWSFDEETGTLTLYEWGGGPFPEATGEYEFHLVWYDNSQDWNIVPGIEADNAALWTFFQKVKDEINHVNREPEPTAPPVAEDTYAAFGYAPPQAWSPEDDEKDASEW